MKNYNEITLHFIEALIRSKTLMTYEELFQSLKEGNSLKERNTRLLTTHEACIAILFDLTNMGAVKAFYEDNSYIAFMRNPEDFKARNYKYKIGERYLHPKTLIEYGI